MNQQGSKNNYHEIADDEIDLVSLAWILIRWKYLILIVFVLCVVVGAVLTFLRQPQYDYITTIEIGSTITNLETGDVRLIESSGEVLEKIKAAYIPLNSHDQSANNIKVTASSPKGSRLILLKSSGSEVSETDHRALHNKIADAVENDHLRRIQPAREQLESRIAMIKTDLDKMMSKDLIEIKKKSLLENVQEKKRDLSSLADQERTFEIASANALNKLESALLDVLDKQKFELIDLQNKIAKENSDLAELADQKSTLIKNQKILSQEKALLSRQVEKLDKMLTDIGQKRLEAPAEVDSPANALTLMMIENQLEQYRTRRENLELKLGVELQQKNNDLEMQLAGTERKKTIQEKLLADLEVQLNFKRQSQAREIEQRQKEIQNLQAEQSKIKGDYRRQQDEINREIIEAENDLHEYEINLGFNINQQKQVVAELEGKLKNLQPTRSLGVAIRSQNPTGQSKILILALSSILGLMGGVMLAFFAEFMKKVRQQPAEDK
ncbi:Wzz/FepE/Etk N-terminal domain-containing protein [uncultured Desulfuromusa sp.]|uniref:Wzz/FepE/Etk N-terminal domain-containing protein n=1 Tax=uncultured Desulfuromusa sp. TaxID=219183 RepID=UPI002AA751F8|nr:Wzz/FepE/Etk N-terminal domain-containing protein [uncultured Desulfuromusa sp.]